MAYTLWELTYKGVGRYSMNVVIGLARVQLPEYEGFLQLKTV